MPRACWDADLAVEFTACLVKVYESVLHCDLPGMHRQKFDVIVDCVVMFQIVVGSFGLAVTEERMCV